MLRITIQTRVTIAQLSGPRGISDKPTSRTIAPSCARIAYAQIVIENADEAESKIAAALALLDAGGEDGTPDDRVRRLVARELRRLAR